MKEDELKKSKEIIMYFLNSEKYAPFKEPVDWQKYQLKTYPKIVKKPMDFLQIQENLIQNKYITVQTFYQDFKLIWDNCRLFNKKTSFVHMLSFNLQKDVNEMMGQKFQFQEKQNGDFINEIQQDKLKELLLNSKMTVVGKVVMFLKSNYPEVLMKETEEEFYMLLNRFPISCYNQILQDFFNQFINESKLQKIQSCQIFKRRNET